MTTANIAKQKISLRKEFMEIRREQCRNSVLESSTNQLLKRLDNYLSKISFETILFYYPITGEVPVLALAEKYFNQKNILFPRIDNASESSMVAIEPTSMASFLPGFKNILEPVGRQFDGEIDIVLVPGIAFCKSDGSPNRYHRLGYGGGFYDRFLQDYSGSLKIGVFYEYAKSRVDFHAGHDIPLDVIISEEMIYDFKSNF